MNQRHLLYIELNCSQDQGFELDSQIYDPFNYSLYIITTVPDLSDSNSISGLAAQGIGRCVNAGEVVQQLEWVLLDAHFALLQALIQQDREGKQPWIVKRCQALTALIRLSSIAPCRELLDMQEKVDCVLNNCMILVPFQV